MATLTLTYDTGAVTLASINDNLAKAWGYQETINGQPNPQTKAAYNRLILAAYIRSEYRRGKRIADMETVDANLPDVILT